MKKKKKGKLILDNEKHEEAWGNILYLHSVSENRVSQVILAKMQEAYHL